MIARLVCHFRGHQPPLFFVNFTSTIPRVTLMAACPRCRRLVPQDLTVKTGTSLRLVKPKDAA